MESCDYCGKLVDERSMSIVDGVYWICPSCNGYYSEGEMSEMLDEKENSYE